MPEARNGLMDVLRRDDAPITVDFVVLTAGANLLALGVDGVIHQSLLDLLGSVSEALVDRGF